MPEIPEKLKLYIPLDRWSRIVNGPFPWRVCVNDVIGNVEIKRAPLLHPFWVIVGFVAAGIFGGLGYYGYCNSANLREDKMFATIFMIIIPLVMIVFMPAVGALGVWVDSIHWKGPLRFRFNGQDGELFFAKEKVTYRPNDYSQLVLGCVCGIDTKTDDPKSTVQIFMLVFDKNEKWCHCNLSDDYVPWLRGHKRFMQVIDRLRPLLEFEVFVKDYSQDECFAQQNEHRDGNGNKVLW